MCQPFPKLVNLGGMKKIYFCGSIRGGRQLADGYQKIIGMLQEHGQVLTEHLGSDREVLEKDRLLSDKEIHNRDLQWIMESDLVVAEVTVPSLGVGYEIGRSVHLGKPVLCLFDAASEQPLSAMIAGCSEVKLFRYNRFDELPSRISKYIMSLNNA
jgi:hypothetical protein